MAVSRLSINLKAPPMDDAWAPPKERALQAEARAMVDAAIKPAKGSAPRPTELLPLLSRAGDQINIFVHGSVADPLPYYAELKSRLARVGLPGKSHFLKWNSGGPRERGKFWGKKVAAYGIPAVLLAAGGILAGNPIFSAVYGYQAWQAYKAAKAAGKVAGLAEFGRGVSRAPEVGGELAKLIRELPQGANTKINVIGYSAGAEVIRQLLDQPDVVVDDVVLVAGAAPAESGEWPDLSGKVRGSIINFASRGDTTLKLVPWKTIGREGAKVPGVRNFFYDGLDHAGFWDHFERIIAKYKAATRPTRDQACSSA